jgi:hypothetical protein
MARINNNIIDDNSQIKIMKGYLRLLYYLLHDYQMILYFCYIELLTTNIFAVTLKKRYCFVAIMS